MADFDAAGSEASRRRAERFGRLPNPVDPTRYVVEVPALPDDRAQPAPPAPAAAPELIAATQFADGRRARRAPGSGQARGE